MKVLIITPMFPPMRSGGADFAFRLSERLSDRGVEVQVITSAHENLVVSDKFRIFPVMRKWSWGEIFKLLRLARRFRPDAIEIHFAGSIYHHQPMVTFLPALFKQFIRGARIVLHIEYPEPIIRKHLPFFPRLIRKFLSGYYGLRAIDYGYGTLLRESDQIILLCDTHRDILEAHQKGAGQKCVTITQPPTVRICDDSGGELSRCRRAELRLAPGDVLLANYGYIYPNKGIETLLEAFSKATKNAPNARLIMVGGVNEVVLKATNRLNYLQELKDYTQQLGIAGKIIWTDYFPTDSEQPSIFLRSADICVLPFDNGITMHRSTFGVVAVHELPIITTRGETLEKPFIDGQNVLLCAPKDSSALAETISRLISNPELQERLREGSRALTKEYFSWERCIDRTIMVFQGKNSI